MSQQSMSKRVRLDDEDLKKEVECPICMEIPRKGPVYACPNGHLVCQRCKVTTLKTCPVCREAMGQNRSLLAVALIEKIHHDCKYDECDEVFKLDELSDHEKVCKHRSVRCPYGACDKKLALSELFVHLRSSNKCCASFHNIKNGETRDKCFAVAARGSKKPKFDRRVRLFWHKGVELALRVNKSGDYYKINIVMFEVEEECAKYNIEMEVYKPNSPPASRHSVRYRGSPSSIDKTKAEIENAGLSVHREVMEKIALLDGDIIKFTVSFSFF